jgi:hypothetical protein
LEEKQAFPTINLVDADWYKWLPEPDTVIAMLEELEGYTLSSFVRNKLKKSETQYNKRAKNAIVLLLFKKARHDLLKKYDVKLSDYGL